MSPHTCAKAKCNQGETRMQVSVTGWSLSVHGFEPPQEGSLTKLQEAWEDDATRPESIIKMFDVVFIQIRLRKYRTGSTLFDEFTVNAWQHNLKCRKHRGFIDYVEFLMICIKRSLFAHFSLQILLIYKKRWFKNASSVKYYL